MMDGEIGRNYLMHIQPTEIYRVVTLEAGFDIR